MGWSAAAGRRPSGCWTRAASAATRSSSSPRATRPSPQGAVEGTRGLVGREDARLEAYVAGLPAAELDAEFEYATTSGRPQRQPPWEALVRLFNHRTHHRGQAHAILTRLGIAEPPALDLLLMQPEQAQHRAR